MAGRESSKEDYLQPVPIENADQAVYLTLEGDRNSKYDSGAPEYDVIHDHSGIEQNDYDYIRPIGEKDNYEHLKVKEKGIVPHDTEEVYQDLKCDDQSQAVWYRGRFCCPVMTAVSILLTVLLHIIY